MEAMESSLFGVAADLGRLALVYRAQGRPAEAVPLFVSAIAMYEHTLGPTHPQVAKDLANLGNALCDLSRHAEAEPLYRRALEIDRAALGEQHPEVAMDLSNLGISKRAQGRLAEAASIFGQALGIMHEAVGPGDPEALIIAKNLATTQAAIDAGSGGGEEKAPPHLERKPSFARRRAGVDKARLTRASEGGSARNSERED
mmetsp:Transcript_1260/g.3219  ORF Transcript_1260/g.3219 Transcript_1260/m.3219 type:complete len:201 (+) Transcript_1260:250-852(+)